MNRGSDYVTEVRTATRQLWQAINTLAAAQREWNALDYTTTLDDDAGTFAGENEGLDATMVGAVVFDTTNALVTLLGAGHATNLAKLL